MMSRRQIGEPILENGIRETHFFNGRLLMAEDLLGEQAAQREHRQRLGRAVGAGIITGLMVTPITSPAGGAGAAVCVTAGLAINRAGAALSLPAESEVVIEESNAEDEGRRAGGGGGSRSGRAGAGGGAFREYRPGPSGGAVLPTLYLLTLAPAGGDEGRAPVSSPGGILTGTGVRSHIEGVTFRLLPCPLTVDAQPLGTLRNRLAHLSFGTDSESGPDGGAGRLCPTLTPEHVPLALIGMVEGRITFIDGWAVREPALPEAMMHQFQAHLADVLRSGPRNAIHARDHFRYLPPVGFLPAESDRFSWREFLYPLPADEIELDPAFVRSWMDQVRGADPIDLSDPAPVWVYAPAGEHRVLFLRRERPPVIRYASTAAVIVDLLLPGRHAPIEPAGVTIYAANAAGQQFPGEPLGRRFIIPSLPPGSYTIWVTAPGCRPSGVHQRLAMGETVNLEIELEAAGRPGADPVVPSLTASAQWLPGGNFVQMAVRPETLQAGALPDSMQGWITPGAPPSAVSDWVRVWGDWVLSAHPELPADPAHARLLINPAVIEEPALPLPHGAVVFGEGGAYLLLTLTGKPARPAPLPVPVPDDRGILVPDTPGPIAVITEPMPTPRRRGLIKRFWYWLTAQEDE